ncbi:MAG: DUF2283 domain-containing protein [Nitrospirae bacterium]|nr:DUF2283 domain-containing protein [Nitrospirota bacterium]MBF0536217.1 DUF2283 domain-containing protein [Nitrospirota bacterium]MBF0617307.1 DUF2283 domain-containing protein [Nitrospirota bacterium]
MDKITITYDKVGNTLDVWFSEPKPCINEEIGGGIIVKKDVSGDIIGFEKLNYLKKENPHEIHSIPLEVSII